MKLRALLLIFILFNCLTSLNAQDEGEITLSGIVLRLDSIKPIPSANIYIKGSTTGVRADNMGLFSIKVTLNDTVVFSAIGSKTTFYIIPDSLAGKSYSIIQRMPIDTISLKTVEITSWPSLEQFNKAFTEEFGYGADMPKAERNANPNMNNINYGTDVDLSNYNAIVGGKYTNVYLNAHIPVENLLNPKRWDKLVNDWKSGKHR